MYIICIDWIYHITKGILAWIVTLRVGVKRIWLLYRMSQTDLE